MRFFKISSLGLILCLILALVAFPLAVSAAPAGSTGFSAKIVATSGQVIVGEVDATGFDVGIYIGPGIHNVVITGATVHGANNEGILVQDTSGIIVKNSTIKGNATDLGPYKGNLNTLSEDKAIVLAGTTGVQVTNNIVESNGHGGICILDDGPNHPFAPNTVTAVPIAGNWNNISNNKIKDNLGDCGIVVSAKNPGGGVSYNFIANNTVAGFNPPGDPIPGVGGIVVAGGAFGPVKLSYNVIWRNTVTGGFLPGISLHAFGPGVITGTLLLGNVLSYNGAGEVEPPPAKTKGIEIFAVPNVGTISNTIIDFGSISNDYYGIWHQGDTATHIGNAIIMNNVTKSTFP